MIIGMHRIFRANHPAHYFNCAVGNHLIGVHIGLRAGAGLPDHQRKVIIQQTVCHLACSRLDSLAFVSIQFAEICIGHRTALFDDPKRTDDRDGLFLPTDWEVDQRSLGLCTPIFVTRNV